MAASSRCRSRWRSAETRDDAGTAEEAVSAGAEAGRGHHVEGAGLTVVGDPVLPARPVPPVMILAGDQSTGPAPEIVRHKNSYVATAANAESASSRVIRSTPRSNAGRVDERTRALDEDQHLRVRRCPVQVLQRVLQGRPPSWPCPRTGPPVGRSRPRPPPGRRERCRHRRCSRRRPRSSGPRGRHPRRAPQDCAHRPATVLAGHSLGTAAGRDNGHGRARFRNIGPPASTGGHGGAVPRAGPCWSHRARKSSARSVVLVAHTSRRERRRRRPRRLPVQHHRQGVYHSGRKAEHSAADRSLPGDQSPAAKDGRVTSAQRIRSIAASFSSASFRWAK